MLDFLRHLRRIARESSGLWGGSGRISYAQCGEDLILAHVFRCLGIAAPRYLDIGAHAPAYLSNPYYFYRLGSRGVLVEPDPALVGELRRRRPGDVCVNAGVGAVSDPAATFFVMSSRVLSTFSRPDAERCAGYGTVRIERTVPVPVLAIGELLRRHCAEPPHLVSIDVEGGETAIVAGFDFAICRPAVFCVETVSYTEDKSERKNGEVGALLEARGYFAYADTYINTIFVDRAAWAARP